MKPFSHVLFVALLVTANFGYAKDRAVSISGSQDPLDKLQEALKIMREESPRMGVTYQYSQIQDQKKFSLREIGTTEEELTALLKQGYGAQACRFLQRAKKDVAVGDHFYLRAWEKYYQENAHLASDYLPTKCRADDKFWSDLETSAIRNEHVGQACGLAKALTEAYVGSLDQAQSIISDYKEAVARNKQKGGELPSNCQVSEKALVAFKVKSHDNEVRYRQHRFEEALKEVQNAKRTLSQREQDLKEAKESYNKLKNHPAEEAVAGAKADQTSVGSKQQ